MASFLLESEARSFGRQAASFAKKAAPEVIREQSGGRTSFDIFLSHARVDEEIVLGVMEQLKDQGLSAYVDWITDPRLDRTRVNAKTADALRARMRQCHAFFYLWSEGAQESRWMPWELGYFDAHCQKVAVLPIVRKSNEPFVGTEYVSLYPLVEFVNVGGRGRFRIGGKGIKAWAGMPYTVMDAIRGD
jgi:TIR domain